MSHQNSDAGGKKPNETPKPETRAEANARADVGVGVTDYTESVKAQRAERKISGVSSATGAGADKDGKGGLASAKDLLGDDAHGITKAEKQAAFMSQIARDGYIVGQKADTISELAQKPKDDPFTKFKNTFEQMTQMRVSITPLPKMLTGVLVLRNMALIRISWALSCAMSSTG
jgi:hypothetical protein